MNSSLLKEAIADAKAVRATALANAKASLEEAFNQRFSAVFADKLREDSAVESPTSVDQNVAETVEPKDATPSKSDGTKGWSSKNGDASAKPTSKSITPNTIPAGKDGGDGTKGWSKDNKGDIDGTPAGVKENVEETAEESVEEAVTNEDLDEIIRELEAEAGASPVDDMGGDPMAGGEGAPADDLPPTDDPAAGGAGEPIMSGDTITITKTPVADPVSDIPDSETPGDEAPPSPEGGPAPMEEEDIDLNELLASLNEESKCDDEKEEADEKEEKDEVDETIVAQLNEAISQRDEAYRTVSYLRTQINEVNLLNAKLLYTNKLFKEFGMNRDQKVQVVEAFDLTKNVREVKMTYANWCSSLNFGGKTQKRVNSQSSVTTITEGMASKPVASTKPADVITESCNAQALRFKTLAGIKVKK